MTNFREAAALYQRFTGLAAVTGLFLMVRFVKYFGGLASLRLVMVTISSAVYDLLVISMIFFIMLGSFVFVFYTRFGVQFPRFKTLPEAFVNLFLFLVGRFNTEDLISINPLYFTWIFTVYLLIFLILINMFLAAIVYRWKDVRRDAQDVGLITTLRVLKNSLMPTHSHGKDQEKQMVKLDSDFWQNMSILRHLGNLDETGKILVAKVEEKDGGGKWRSQVGGNDDSPSKLEAGGAGLAALPDKEGEGMDPEAESEMHPQGGFDFRRAEDQKKFLKVFKKAHMEIASQMCRAVDTQRHDVGAGVGILELEDGAGGGASNGANGNGSQQRLLDADGASPHGELIGIIEYQQPEQVADAIAAKLTKKLEESEHPAEEIWLDALVTVLEESGGLDKLQGFFLPMPMILPKKPEEWGNFNQKKMKMERRLDLFLQWLQAEARIKHYGFLKIQAESKERVLKQQSLVLTDYLETLDQQIESLQEHIKVLERKNAHMRSHVSPLL